MELGQVLEFLRQLLELLLLLGQVALVWYQLRYLVEQRKTKRTTGQGSHGPR
jgi:hypothetical protein